MKPTLSYGFEQPYSAIPTWLIPRDSILTGQHHGFDSEPYKLDPIRENPAVQGTNGYNSLYLLPWLSGPDVAYTQDLRVQLLDIPKDSTIQI